MAGFQQLKVFRNLVFTGFANHDRNVEGNFNPDRIMKEWNFKELALNETNDYTKYVDDTSAVALANGGITLTTAATDTKTCSYGFGGIHVLAAKKPYVEFKFQLDAITNVAINAVLNDAASEGTGALPFLISGTTIADTATNSLGFCFDTNQTTARWYAVQTIDGSDSGQLLSATQAPFAAATDLTLGIELDTSGNATYFINGKQVWYKALATTAATPLVPYFGIRNNTATSHVATVRYVRLWEDA
jgi:hypothetical protein